MSPIAMMYNIVKMHRCQLLKINLGEMNQMQKCLAKDFGYSYDQVPKSLKECMQELAKAKLSLHSPPEVWEVLTDKTQRPNVSLVYGSEATVRRTDGTTV